MQINEQMNLVLTIDRADGTVAYVHAMPVSRSVFEANFLLMSKAFAAIHSEGLGAVAGPRVAALMLQRLGADMGTPNPAQALLAEIRRLSNAILPTSNGWDVMPFDAAVSANLLDDADVAEVMGAICFFTLGSHMYPRRIRMEQLISAADLWQGQILSLDSTAFAASLQTSTTLATSAATAPVEMASRTSSVPS